MTLQDFIEACIVEGLTDPAILARVAADRDRLDREPAAEILATLRSRASLSIQQKRDQSALKLEIITRRAIELGDLPAAVGAQKALATLEGLELDPSLADARAASEVPPEQIDARIAEILHDHPELLRAALQAHPELRSLLHADA